MALTTTETELRVATDGTSQVLSYPFKIFGTGDVSVDKIDNTTFVVTALVISTDYTITALNNDFDDGATITMVATHASGSTFVVNRDLDETQDSTITEAPALDIVHDTLTMLTQRHSEELKRCIRIPIQEEAIDDLDNAGTRDDTIMTFDSSGDLELSPKQSSVTETSSAIITALIAAGIFKA